MCIEKFCAQLQRKSRFIWLNRKKIFRSQSIAEMVHFRGKQRKTPIGIPKHVQTDD